MKKLLATLLFAATMVSAQTSSNLKLNKTMRDGAVTWSNDLNANWDLLDKFLSGGSALPGITLSSPVTPSAAGGTTVGSAALPFSSVFVGASATNNFIITGTATAARTFTLLDTASDTFTMNAATQTLSGKSFNQNVLPLSAGATDVGSTALPWGNLWLGAAATNNFKFQPAALSAARVITVADPGGAATLAYTNPTTAQALSGLSTLSPATAGNIAIGTAALPFGSIVVGTAATNVLTITPAADAAARAITLADPGGAATVAYINNTSMQTVSGPQSFTGNKAQLTSDFTDANASGLQVITGLSFAPPSAYVGNISFHCGLMFSQATPVAGDQFGLAVLTTAPTRADAMGIVGTNVTTFANGPLTNLTTTTPTSIVTFTLVPSTVSPAMLDGTVQFAGGGAQTLQFYVTNGTAANVIVVKAGSYCSFN